MQIEVTEQDRSIAKEVWAGWFSSLMEAYNMAIYSFAAPFLAPMLFKGVNSSSAIFFSYALVFIGFSFFYPAGAIYYGVLGDKKGRQKTCSYSALGLAIATGMMGLIPIDFFGNSAWICFLFLICTQYFFSGGEYHGSIVFSLEHSKKKQNGLMSGISCLFAVFGLIAANGLATLSSKIVFHHWYRVFFLIGFIGGVISYFVKNQCKETPLFTSISEDVPRQSNWGLLLQRRWRAIGGGVLLLSFFVVIYSFLFIFLPLVQPTNFDTFTSLIAYGLLLVIAGILADRFGIKKVMTIGAGLLTLSMIPLFYFFQNLLLKQMILTIFASLCIGPIHTWLNLQFEVQERCRGIFVASAIAYSLFGGSTIPICLLIFEKFHSLLICSLFPLAIALGSFSYLLFSKSRHSYN